MKKYKLLKDLPFAKAGDIFKGELEFGTTVLHPEDYENYKHKLSSDEFWDFDEWFEEVKEFEQYFIINMLKATVEELVVMCHEQGCIENMKSLGLLFKTEEEAEKHLAYLKAKEVIRQDAKGFKPDWNDYDESKYYGYWDFKEHKPDWGISYMSKGANIYFKRFIDIDKSFREHPKEWKAYLAYEQ